MQKRPAMLQTKTSAGGVVYKKEGDTIDVALIKVKNGSVLTLPKGTVDEGESYADTALREVREETGLTGDVETELGNVSYWFYSRGENVKYRKTVYYFLLKYMHGQTANHDAEVDDALWLDIDEALAAVSYKNDREILKKAIDVLKRQ